MKFTPLDKLFELIHFIITKKRKKRKVNYQKYPKCPKMKRKNY